MVLIVKGLKLIRTCELLKRRGGGARPPSLSDTVNESDTGDEANGDNNLGASLFNFRRSNEEFGDCGVGNISSESYRPEYRQMKAKRLLLLDEVGYIYVPRLSLSRARAHKHSFLYIYDGAIILHFSLSYRYMHKKKDGTSLLEPLCLDYFSNSLEMV